MAKYLKTIRAKLLFTFVCFLVLTGGFMLITDYWFEAQERKIQNILQLIEDINNNLQTTKRLEYVFLNDEVINEQFYQSGLSQVLIKRREKIEQIKKDFIRLEGFKSLQSAEIQQDISFFKQKFAEYEEVFAEMVKLIKMRGFKGYGLEGRMRNYIHNLENTQVSMVKLLTIRRHEKDFILRKQKDYLRKWTESVESLRQDLAGQKEPLLYLAQYAQNFQQLAQIEEKIGFSDNEGLKRQLTSINQLNEDKIQHITSLIEAEVNSIKLQNEGIRLLVFTLGLTFFIFIAIYLTQLLSKPISQLSTSIHRFVATNFAEKPQHLPTSNQDEIGQLSRDLDYLAGKVQNSLQEIQEKSDKIAEKQEILMNGVNYAQRIQQAILPDYDLAQYFKNHFVLFRPQYDVSGDFYWFTHNDNKCYVATIDCTGRGIAGAFMSLISYTLLNKIIKENKLADLSLILETLNLELRIALRQDKQRSDDSLEICLCCVENSPEKENFKKVTFVGAMRPLLYSSGWEIHEIKGTTRPVGGTISNGQANFETHQFEIKKGNFLYLTTNGFVNQQDKKGKPFGNTQFKELLQMVIHLPMEEQKKYLSQEMDNFLAGAPARDDITVLALKL
ncbi:MAG: SpoIIE family protein phosphatase [Microscillaceae bacterium]|jgi:serine phosphatase RsbU (regulator of sigma subunit)|nr:SpoIIE family protein phosphatase [Microscillaceae bacterium]